MRMFWEIKGEGVEASVSHSMSLVVRVQRSTRVGPSLAPPVFFGRVHRIGIAQAGFSLSRTITWNAA
jgi:hypothetical protein